MIDFDEVGDRELVGGEKREFRHLAYFWKASKLSALESFRIAIKRLLEKHRPTTLICMALIMPSPQAHACLFCVYTSHILSSHWHEHDQFFAQDRMLSLLCTHCKYTVKTYRPRMQMTPCIARVVEFCILQVNRARQMLVLCRQTLIGKETRQDSCQPVP